MIRLIVLLISMWVVTSNATADIFECSRCGTVNQQSAGLCRDLCGIPSASTVPTWGMPQLPYCPTCMARTPGLYEMTPGMGQWWMPQAPHYWNFYMPGPYNGWGMMPNYFPQPPYPPQHGGGFYAAKPVVYFRGPKGSKVEVELVASKGELMVTVPVRKHWKGEIHGNKLKTSEGDYEYFFYDAWMDHNGMQDQRGMCGDRQEALSYMEAALKQAEFPSEAMQEFKATWSVKLPHQQELCVFPQTEDQLKSAVQLKIKPSTAKLTRLEFVVVAKKFFGSPEAKTWSKFTREPKGEYSFRRLASVAKEPFKGEIRVFDWGVGFLRAEK